MIILINYHKDLIPEKGVRLILNLSRPNISFKANVSTGRL